MKKLLNILFAVFIIGIFVYCLPIAINGMKNVFFNETYNKAIAGDINEQVRLAQLYQIGKFTEPSSKLAQEWYIKAAHNGSKAAHDILCWDYKIGCEK